MRADLQLLCDHAPHGRTLARSIVVRRALIERIKAADIDRDDFWDLNPHLQLQHVADMVMDDVKAEGFTECTREEVYLMWLTSHIFTSADFNMDGKE